MWGSTVPCLPDHGNQHHTAEDAAEESPSPQIAPFLARRHRNELSHATPKLEQPAGHDYREPRSSVWPWRGVIILDVTRSGCAKSRCMNVLRAEAYCKSIPLPAKIA